MTAREYNTNSAEETIALGRELAPVLRTLRVVLLHGDLGAGKTTLVKGIAQALEAASQDDVTSPTFTLIHEYRGPQLTVYHVDLYRINTERELATLGLDELFADEGNLVLIEWGEKFSRLILCRVLLSPRKNQDTEVGFHAVAGVDDASGPMRAPLPLWT